MVLVSLWLAYFMQHNALQVHPEDRTGTWTHPSGDFFSGQDLTFSLNPFWPEETKTQATDWGPKA